MLHLGISYTRTHSMLIYPFREHQGSRVERNNVANLPNSQRDTPLFIGTFGKEPYNEALPPNTRTLPGRGSRGRSASK